MERIDTEGLVNCALRAAGFKIDKDSTEKVLQIADFVRSNPDATLKDIMRISVQVDELNGVSELPLR